MMWLALMSSTVGVGVLLEVASLFVKGFAP